MVNFKLESKPNPLCTAFLLIVLQTTHLITTADDFSDHIQNCCNGGKTLAKKQNNCETYEYNIMSISPLWRGLCVSTYAVCCSHELEKIYCASGRLAALTGSRCNEQHNSTSYSDCCRACQIGLAVKASGNSCSDAYFDYFSDIKSFQHCCGEINDSRLDAKPSSNLKGNNVTKKGDNMERSSQENADGTIILGDDDEVPNIVNRESGIFAITNEPKKKQRMEKCSQGFQLKQERCVDINECEDDNTACDSNQVCVNDIPGYHCDCKIGFNLDTTTNACVDINECSINNHNCRPTQRCDNTIGSYVCTRLLSCGTGYTLNADSNTCDDNDECATNTHNCKEGYNCVNTKGSFRCYPKLPTTQSTTSTTTTAIERPSTASVYNTYNHSPYYKYYPYVSRQTSSRHFYESFSPPPPPYQQVFPQCEIGLQRNHLQVCVDINECALPTSPCGSHQRCINTNGSYRCENLLKCQAGYKSSPKGTQCVDIDECETGEHNCIESQTCYNRNGGYVCSCQLGHHLTHPPGSEARCVDINECDQKGFSLCPTNAQCINTIGSYFCECKSGFQKSRENERICLDVDECNEIHGLCHQKCVNFFGGYRCSCNNGYELGPDNRTCIDIDECEIQQSHKLCMGFCENVPGSYECSCPRGYTLAGDRYTCLDIDECASGEFCTGRKDVCTNKRGGYKCTTIHCPYGYTNDQEQKTRCRLTNSMCEGEDCFNKPSAYTYNFVTFVSKMIVPPEGRTFFNLKGPIWYDDIEFDIKIVKTIAAANIEKATPNHFGTVKGDHEVTLSLKRSLEGPQEIEIDLTMTVFTRGLLRGKSVAKIYIIVSQYTF